MYKVILIAILFFQAQFVFACSCTHYVKEFCYSADTSDYIALVELIEFEDSSAAIFKLIENINKEIPDTISIIGDDGFYCYLDFRQFEVGDTLVINTSFFFEGIQNFSNSNFYNWGIDDCARNYLEFSSDMVFGELDTFTDLLEIEYEVFKDNLFECFDFTLSTDNITNEEILIYPNPCHDQLYVVSPGNPVTQVNVYDIEGRRLTSSLNGNLKNRLTISLGSNKSGLLLIEIVTPKGILRKRVVKL